MAAAFVSSKFGELTLLSQMSTRAASQPATLTICVLNKKPCFLFLDNDFKSTVW